MSALNKILWENSEGFANLSPGAQEIARYADKNSGSISGIFTQKPELVSSLDEFHTWTAETLPAISGKDSVNETGHSLKEKLKKLN